MQHIQHKVTQHKHTQFSVCHLLYHGNWLEQMIDKPTNSWLTDWLIVSLSLSLLVKLGPPSDETLPQTLPEEEEAAGHDGDYPSLAWN